MNTYTQETRKSAYEALLLSYAAGTLDEAQNLVVSTHLTYAPRARKFVSQCEALGGVLIESACEPVAMSKNALRDVLAHLDDCPCENGPCTPHHFNSPLSFDIPMPLQDAVRDCCTKDWGFLMPGMQTLNIELRCKQSTARLIKIKRGVKSPNHTHRGLEITLVLDGAFTDDNNAYHRGDLVVSDETCNHAPQACPELGCTCMVVTTAPIRLTGIAGLLNPFVKF